MKKILVFLLFSLTLPGSVISQRQPDSQQLAAWEQFKNQHGQTWTVRWHKKTGTPRIIYQGTTSPYRGIPRAAARTFLQEMRTLFKMKPALSDLKFVRTREDRGIQHVKFQQTYKGLHIEGAEYLVHIRADGRVDMANGVYYPHIEAPVQPDISGEQAMQIARDDLGGNVVLMAEAKSELVIYPVNDQFFLAWKLRLPTLEPAGDWLFFVHAGNGIVLRKQNELMDVTGSGKAYPKHPNNSSVSNVSLYRLDGTGYLRGTYVNVLNAVDSRAYSSSHSFEYSTSNTHFDEANMYYHVDRYRASYINDFGYDGFGQITANVHYNTWLGPNNAWYSSSTGQIYFGDGTPSQGYYDFAREDKVIYHEYTHAMADEIAGISSPSNEEGAISEGNADYFPGSFTNRTKIGDYVAPSLQRDMANPDITTYSAYQSSNKEPHAGGEFWSATLWDLHNSSVGASKSDWLVYGALNRITSNPTFSSYREAMLVEDDARYAGTHIGKIKDVLNARGIGDPALTVTISGPTFLECLESGNWTANVSYGDPPYTYEWRFREPAFYGTWSSVVGTSSSFSRSMDDTDFEVQVKVESDFSSYTETVYETHVVYHTCGGLPKLADNSREGISADETVPTEFSLEINFPNPFNPSTEILFALPENANARLMVFDVTGREVARLVDGYMEAGYHSVRWTADNQPSGVYFYRLESGTFVQSKRMVLLK